MKVSLLGPTNLKKFSSIIGKNQVEIENIADDLGKIIAKGKCNLQVVFNLAGMLKLVSDSYKKEGGKLIMLYTENDYDWETKSYISFLNEADLKVKLKSWHDMLLYLVSDTNIVICAGLSSGVFAELAYIKWNHQENKCRLKAIVGIKELLKEGKFPPEIEYD